MRYYVSMRVRDVMSTELFTVDEDTPLAEVQRKLDRHDIHHLLVRQDDGRIVGIITDRDVLQYRSPFVGKLAERDRDRRTLELRAHQVMTHGVFSVGHDATLRDAADAILDRKISCVGVLGEDGVIAGILTWRDLLSAMVDPEGSLDGTKPPSGQGLPVDIVDDPTKRSPD